ncbi:MAG: DUF1631 family protein [Gammaproteobacteria bacterium]|nr:DUF1631 family protein [Gammaproteobacteria bacterium]
MFDKNYKKYASAMTGNTVIELILSVPSEKEDIKHLQFQGRIVRPDERGAGIALLSPNLDSLQTLNAYIKTQYTQPANAQEKTALHEKNSSENQTQINPDLENILASCKKIINECLEPLIKSSQKHIIDALFKASEKSKDVTQQNAYFDSLNILNRSQDKLKEIFISSALTQLNTYCTDPKTINKSSEDYANSGEITLSLIEEDVLEDWLAITEITNLAKARNNQELSAIEQHLSTLYQIEINEENNPFGPMLFAQAFEDGIQHLALNHVADQLCYTVFKGTLNTTLADIYKKILSLLSRIKLPEKNVPDKENEPSAPSQPKETSMDHSPQIDEEEEPVINPETEAHKPLEEKSTSEQPKPQIRAGDQDIYQLVKTLRNLKQPHNSDQNSTHTQSKNNRKLSKSNLPFETDLTERPVATAPAIYRPTEILNALNHLQEKTSPQYDAPIEHTENSSINAQVLNILSQENSEQNNRTISDRETGIMEVGGHLFASLFRDRLVSDNVRAWLKRLEIPMLKLAIVDDSLFNNQSHVARQVVNKISQLELYGEDNPITTRVNGLLDRIVNEVGKTPDIFEQVLKEVDFLIKIQNKAYAENLKEVVTECEKEHINPRTKKTPIDPLLEQWIKQVRRIKIGSWLLFSSDSNHPTRLRLAWIAKDKTRYIFVNLRGLKEISFDISEIAQQLRNGTTIILDNANDPAMDRAQYQMLQNMHHQLLHEATHDQLTGLINRREFESCLHKAYASANQNNNTQHILYYLDLDHLNVVNTTCGYDAGDKLLIEVTTLLQKKIGKNGIFARIGGDEFAILLIDCTLDEALNIAQQQKKMIQEYRLIWEEKRLSVAVRIGMVQINGKETSAATLLQAAESSCKAAKRKGSNSIQVFSHDDAELSLRQRTLEWAAHIDQALDENTLELRCQRITLIQNNTTLPPFHSEILLGVTDEQGNEMSPQELILAAEEYHRMPAIDRWVIRNVFNWMIEHDDELKKTGSLSINLSGSSLNDDTFLDFVLNEIKSTKVPTNKICFEITETAGIANLSNAVEFIEEVKKTGCQFSLDDFGSGLSSYGYLKNLPIDYLKIDGNFVQYMDNNPCDYAVVKSITEVGHFMGKKIIAEYVENETVLDMLKEIGVDYAQGYGIEKPYKLSDLTKIKSSVDLLPSS